MLHSLRKFLPFLVTVVHNINKIYSSKVPKLYKAFQIEFIYLSICDLCLYIQLYSILYAPSHIQEYFIQWHSEWDDTNISISYIKHSAHFIIHTKIKNFVELQSYAFKYFFKRNTEIK